jgi:hypothetical protein
MKALFLTFSIFAIVSAQTVDWCKIPSCSPKTHIACNNNGVNFKPTYFKVLRFSSNSIHSRIFIQPASLPFRLNSPQIKSNQLLMVTTIAEIWLPLENWQSLRQQEEWRK